MKKITLILMALFASVTALANSPQPQQICSSPDQRIKIVTTADALLKGEMTGGEETVTFDGKPSSLADEALVQDRLPHSAISVFRVVVSAGGGDTHSDSVICRDYSY